MKTINQFQEWCAGACQELGDPCLATGLIFARYLPTVENYEGPDIAAAYEAGDRLMLYFAPDAAVQVAISTEGPKGSAERLLAFGMEKIAPGLWALVPSLNLPNLVHAFVVLYDVSDPAPWESRIILTDNFRIQTEV
jgi:hypothetical protein